jgi:leucine dehydrogenase
MRAFGRAVSRLGGRYFTAEDVGTSCEDMSEIRRETKWIFGLKETSGDPSPQTARGVFAGIEASVGERLRCDSLNGLRVLVQGVGHVGHHLCAMLHRSGARLLVSDINRAAAERCAQEFGATVVDPDHVYDTEAEVYAPCALGATVSVENLERLKVSIIAGAANNQLRDAAAAAELRQRNILYAPDYVINAGGIINIACEMNGAYQSAVAAREIAKIKPRLQEVFRRARIEGKDTWTVADEMARERFRVRASRRSGGPGTVLNLEHAMKPLSRSRVLGAPPSPCA